MRRPSGAEDLAAAIELEIKQEVVSNTLLLYYSGVLNLGLGLLKICSFLGSFTNKLLLCWQKIVLKSED